MILKGAASYKRPPLLQALLLLSFFSLAFHATSQTKNAYADSIYNLGINNYQDTARAIFLFSESTRIFKKNPVAARAILTKALTVSGNLPDRKWIGKNKSLLGTIEYSSGNYKASETYFNEALEIYRKMNYLYGQALVLNNLANLYRDKGEFNTAIDYYIKSLKLKEELNDKKGIVSTLNNVANLHLSQSDMVSARKYYDQAKIIAEKIKDPESMAMTYSNLANIYYDLKEMEKSFAYDTLALYYRKKTGDKAGIAISLNNISSYYETKKNFKPALHYIDQALQIKNEMGDKQGIAVSLSQKGTIFLNMQQPDSAIYYLHEALKLAGQLSIKKRISICYQNLAKAYANKKDWDKAYEYERKYSNLKDSLSKENYQKYISEMEAKYDTEKKQKEIELLTKDAHLNKLMLRERELESESKARRIELLNKENELVQIQNEKSRFEIENKKAELENKQKRITLLGKEKEIQSLEIKNHQAYIRQQKMFSYFVAGGFILAIIAAFYIFTNLKKQRRANQIISLQKAKVDKQKSLIEEHQKETIDSINYAKRIQYALLANKEILDRHLSEYFILFNPKDIVSGDFYWAAHQNNRFYLAVCDSTGHGVPGAFMSLLNIGFLSEAIKEREIQKPNEVLDYVRQRLISSIGADGQRDGMDAILLCMESAENGTFAITYAAANNSPVLMKQGNIVLLPKDKMPVGKGERTENFNLFTVDANKGDMLYLYTDGFADQFGGPDGKKFKYKPLNELLLSVSVKESSEQFTHLSKRFEEWKGKSEQVDDVCIVGIKL